MFQSILVPVDITETYGTQKILKAAKEVAQKWGSEVYVVTVAPDFGKAIVGAHFSTSFEAESRNSVQAELDSAIETAGVTAKTYVFTGTIYDRVITLAAKLDVDLIVIGAHRPELKDYLLGSNAARLVRHSNRSVLVVRD